MASSIGVLLNASNDFDSDTKVFMGRITKLELAISKYEDKINEGNMIVNKVGGFNFTGTAKQVTEVGRILKESKLLQETVDVQVIKIKMPTSLYKRRIIRYDFLIVISLTGIFLGFTMFLFGLVPWYRKDQMQAD